MPRPVTAPAVAAFRDRVCLVAADLFAEKGFDGFSMRELAGRLGISAMTPYRYFRDKEEIMSELRVRAFARFAEWLETQLSMPEADQAVLGRSWTWYAIKEPSQYRLMFELAEPAPIPLQDALENRVRNILAAYLAAHGRANGDPERSSILLLSALHGAGALYSSGKLSNQEFSYAVSDAVRLCVGSPAAAKHERMHA
jgi:AcrR family transcriptional regulator